MNNDPNSQPFDPAAARAILKKIGAPGYDAEKFACGLNSANAILLNGKKRGAGYQPSKSKERLIATTRAIDRLTKALTSIREDITVLENAVKSLDDKKQLPRSEESVPIERVIAVPTWPSFDPTEVLAVRVPQVVTWLVDLEQRLFVARKVSQEAADLLLDAKRYNDTPGVDEVRAIFYQSLLVQYRKARNVGLKYERLAPPPKLEGRYVACPVVDFLVDVVLKCPAELESIRSRSAARKSPPKFRQGQRDEIYQAVAAVYDRLAKPKKRRT